MAAPREIHIRATATGAWVVHLDDDQDPLSWHTNETEAEQTALTVAATYGGAPSIVVHDRYHRRRVAPLSGRPVA